MRTRARRAALALGLSLVAHAAIVGLLGALDRARPPSRVGTPDVRGEPMWLEFVADLDELALGASPVRAPESAEAPAEDADDVAEHAPTREAEPAREPRTSEHAPGAPTTSSEPASDAPTLGPSAEGPSAEGPSAEGPSAEGPSASEPTTTAPHATVAEEDAARERARQLILGARGTDTTTSVRASELLGEALTCEDPIEGTWVSDRYDADYRDWARMTLHIEHDGAQLRGSIVAHMWSGLPSDRRPPPCQPGGWDYTVTMTASGNLLGDQLAFGASTHRVSRAACASSAFAYNPDHFTGRVDALADRLLTLNNDGGRDVNAPYTFRRTSCRP